MLDDIVLRRARRRLLEMHHRARVGHLGGNLSCLDALMVIHHELLKPADRLILSKGHSAGALYVTLWSLDRVADSDLDTFHQDGTLLAGHPPPRGLSGIDFATGSLGHGLSLAAGTALAARLKGEARTVYCLTSDGEWQEGSTFEGLVFASHHRLSNLVIAIDHNHLQGFGKTADVAALEPLQERLSGFDVELRVANGHDLGHLRRALIPDMKRPVVAVLETRKGAGVPNFEGRLESHYLPLDEVQFSLAIEQLGLAR